jgi:hypothetical protein
MNSNSWLARPLSEASLQGQMVTAAPSEALIQWMSRHCWLLLSANWFHPPG